MSTTTESVVAARRRGFTLIELLVAMTITILLGLVVVMAYNSSMQAYYLTERKLQALAAFRNTADRLEREVNSMVFKAGVWERPAVTAVTERDNYLNAWWETMVKYIHADPESPNSAIPRNTSTAVLLNWATSSEGRSMYQVNFRPRYLGYYSTPDGFTIDRTALYFNPAEDRQVWANGEDDDGDDPDPLGDDGLRILYDDRGCLMFDKVLDADMAWAEWYDPGVKKINTAGDYNLTLGAKNADRVRPNDYRDHYHGPYSHWKFDPQTLAKDGGCLQSELEGPLTKEFLIARGDIPADWDTKTIQEQLDLKTGFIRDSGTVIGEGFSDLRFYYLYKRQAIDKFIYADWWPWDDDNNPTTDNGKDLYMMYSDGEAKTKPLRQINVLQGGVWHNRGTCTACGSYHNDGYAVPRDAIPTDFDVSYFTLPMAISAKFTFTVNRQEHVYEKLIYLHASRWLMYLNP